jgi:hypothetical protein
MDDVHYYSWCRVLESTFLKYNWSSHAKIHTYTERTRVKPNYIEEVVTASIIGNCQFIKERGGNTPTTKVILHLTPHLPLLVTIIVDFSVSPWTIVTYYYTQDISDINEKWQRC